MSEDMDVPMESDPQDEAPVSDEIAAVDPDAPREPKEIVRRPARAIAVKNKIRRRALAAAALKEKRVAKKARQAERKKAEEALGDQAPPKQVPKTIDSLREHDETTVLPTVPAASTDDKTTEDADVGGIDEEVAWDLENDEFKEYFQKTYVPKVIITSGDNPHSRTIAFMKELSRIIPNAEPMWRKNASLKKTTKQAIERGFTDVIVINEDNRIPNGMLVSHLPDGPTALFRLSNVKITKELHKDWRNISSLRPEIILNNFSTRLGHTVGRMLASLFHYEPQFTGTRAVTFHNQRDYIFFRHHVYKFKNKEKVKLHELGPRFTLKLRSLQKGLFDSAMGEYEWIISGRRHDMETSRRRFFL